MAKVIVLFVLAACGFAEELKISTGSTVIAITADPQLLEALKAPSKLKQFANELIMVRQDQLKTVDGILTECQARAQNVDLLLRRVVNLSSELAGLPAGAGGSHDLKDAMDQLTKTLNEQKAAVDKDVEVQRVKGARIADELVLLRALAQ